MFVLASIMSYVVNLESRKDEKGATAVEYGLLVALIAVVLIAGATLFGDKLNNMFTSVSSKL